MATLKQLRKSRHLTQLDVARAISCPRPIYALIEGGKLAPREGDYEALAGLYNVSVGYLKKGEAGSRLQEVK